MRSKSCTFLTAGDVAPDRKKGGGLFAKAAPLFQEADFSFVNLEHTLARSGKLLKGKPFFHRGVPGLAEGFTEAGIDLAVIANNHMLDFGEEAFFETLDVLDEHGLPYVGAGKDLTEARAPVIMERKGLRIGVLAYSTTLPQGSAAGPNEPGVNPLRVETVYRIPHNPYEYPGIAPEIETRTVPADLRRIKGEVQRLRRQADIVLVYVHWGVSMTHAVRDFQREIGHAAIDSGAAAVFGGHQHVLSAVEFYKGCPIVHSTGNFIFDVEEPFFTEATQETFLFGGNLTRKGLEDVYLIPARCGIHAPPQVLSPGSGMGGRIVEKMRGFSAPFGTGIKVRDGRAYLTPPKK